MCLRTVTSRLELSVLSHPSFSIQDTSATNFMIRDARMQQLVATEKEPITPFISKVRESCAECDNLMEIKIKAKHGTASTQRNVTNTTQRNFGTTTTTAALPQSRQQAQAQRHYLSFSVKCFNFLLVFRFAVYMKTLVFRPFL